MAGQTDKGKAFEWAVALQLIELLGLSLEGNPVYQQYYDKLQGLDKESYNLCAYHAVRHIIEKENLTGKGYFTFLTDKQGEIGDSRDIVINVNQKNIGISCKTNHQAYKHSRLSPKIDFVKKWNLDPNGCSPEYLEAVTNVFAQLTHLKESNNVTKWSEVKNKEDNYYIPILEAFEKEIRRIESPSVCSSLLHYLIGINDFYKIIAKLKNKTVIIQGYNVNGTLNIDKLPLATKIISTEISSTSLIITFAQDWKIKFRIHSASTKIESSLKFDVTALSQPSQMYECVKSIAKTNTIFD